MHITFTDSFFKSIRKINRQNTWPYRLFYLFKYRIPGFFRNIYRFRKELYTFRDWDSAHNLSLFKRSLVLLRNNIEKHGNEVKESRDKKIEAMTRVIGLLDIHINDGYIDAAETDLGLKINTEKSIFDPTTEDEKKIFIRATEIEEELWAELWKIIKGSGDWEDGTDMRGWWD